MKYDAKIIAKAALIFFGLLFLICVWLGRKEHIKEAPQGENITCRDVEILLEALNISASDHALNGSADRYLTYEQYIAIYQQIDGASMNLPDYADRYDQEHLMLKSDWYETYRIMLAYLDSKSSVWETTVFLLRIDEETGEAYTESGALRSVYGYLSPEFKDNVLRELRVYMKGQQLLTVVETFSGEYELKNVWVTESSDGLLDCFYHQTAFRTETEQSVERETIADLSFQDGRVVRANGKTEKIHGKLLWVSDEELEIEGKGVYPISDGMEIYKLYGSLKTLGRADLKIGYADTDYVIEKGKVCACLVSVREEADRIRVLLKNTAQSSNYYDAVELVVDGESIRIEADDLEKGERRIYQSAALTDKITINVEGVEKGDNAYRGSVECYRSNGGMVLINELPLEEYLYAVVPSEMPASYPLEALKAQAVCARTYAYLYILHAGLPELGAHVDDTTSYQVYHNIRENAATTTAVKETDGILLTYQGEPAQNYYYSTSCGIGTDAGIWKSGNTEDTAYMRAARLNRSVHEEADANRSAVYVGGEQSEDSQVQDLRDEEKFRTFITAVDEDDLESGEPWYRWTYTVESVDEDVLLSRIQERYAASPQSVLTKTEGEYYVSEPVEQIGKINDISIVRRGAGGVADELLIVADTGTYKIVAEYNIRSVLCDRKSAAVKQDGSTVVPVSLIPSGFFVIETGKSNGNVVGYTLIGGGYGHGVGMSQNGAKALGQEGVTCEQILAFFFEGCELGNIAAIADL